MLRQLFSQFILLGKATADSVTTNWVHLKTRHSRILHSTSSVQPKASHTLSKHPPFCADQGNASVKTDWLRQTLIVHQPEPVEGKSKIS